jgi:hypothetical protein
MRGVATNQINFFFSCAMIGVAERLLIFGNEELSIGVYCSEIHCMDGV